MITISELTKTYKGKVQALKDVSLKIDGGMFGLIGPNGAGKTTLMRLMAGLISPTSGAIHIDGHDMATSSGRQAVKGMLGYLPQELGLYPQLTGREFLDYVGILKGITHAPERRAQVEELLETERLTDVADKRLKTYSGGMKRRTGIAQALLGQPRLLIVDEPTAGLDPEERVRFRNLLSDVAARCTVILSTHIIEDINQSCNALALMHEGRIAYMGTPVDLLQKAQGYVWTISTRGERPEGDFTVVATRQLADGVQYRVVGEPGDYPAKATAPALEDGYIWLMRSRNQPIVA